MKSAKTLAATAFDFMNVLSLLRTIFLVLLFSQYARNVKFPLPIYKSKKGWTAYKFQLFKMFPVSSRSCHPQLYHNMPLFTPKTLGKGRRPFYICDDDTGGLTTPGCTALRARCHPCKGLVPRSEHIILQCHRTLVHGSELQPPWSLQACCPVFSYWLDIGRVQ